MPIYDYRCDSCGYEFEELRSFSDDDPEECPECGEDSVRRLISGGNFQLKGNGWYETDYGKKASGPPSSNGDSDSESDTDTDTTTSDASVETGGEAA